MFRALVILELALVLSACGGANDKIAYTDFFPMTDGTFRYQAAADAFYPSDSATAEADRIAWLEGYLHDSAFCPDGYAITERNVVKISDGLFGAMEQVNYEGRCT